MTTITKHELSYAPPPDGVENYPEWPAQQAHALRVFNNAGVAVTGISRWQVPYPKSPFQPGQVVWKLPYAGFGVYGGYAQIAQDTEYEPGGCMAGCDNPDCGEWMDLFMLWGRNRAEAVENLVAGRYAGIACHVSDCQMTLTGPGEDSC